MITDGNVTISEEENWKAEAIELTKCKNGSTEIQYEWKEASPIKYYSSAYKTTQEGLDTKYSYFKTVITNSCTVEYGKVHVEKRIDKKVYDAMTDKPSLSFTLYGTDMYGNGYRKTQKVSFDDPTHVTYVDGSDYVTVSTDFTDLEMGTYYLEETDADIFKWDYVTDVSNGTVEEKDSLFSKLNLSATSEFKGTQFAVIDAEAIDVFTDMAYLENIDQRNVFFNQFIPNTARLGTITIDNNGAGSLTLNETAAGSNWNIADHPNGFIILQMTKNSDGTYADPIFSTNRNKISSIKEGENITFEANLRVSEGKVVCEAPVSEPK